MKRLSKKQIQEQLDHMPDIGEQDRRTPAEIEQRNRRSQELFYGTAKVGLHGTDKPKAD